MIELNIDVETVATVLGVQHVIRRGEARGLTVTEALDEFIALHAAKRSAAAPVEVQTMLAGMAERMNASNRVAAEFVTSFEPRWRRCRVAATPTWPRLSRR